MANRTPRIWRDPWAIATAAGGSPSSNPGVLLAVVLALCLASRVYFILKTPYCAEDAYITFRYALHWARGLGPVYNAGEKVWGFTSPLWTSYLALAVLAGAPVEQAARWTLVGCDLATLWLGWRLLRGQSVVAAAGFGGIKFTEHAATASAGSAGNRSTCTSCTGPMTRECRSRRRGERWRNSRRKASCARSAFRTTASRTSSVAMRNDGLT